MVWIKIEPFRVLLFFGGGTHTTWQLWPRQEPPSLPPCPQYSPKLQEFLQEVGSRPFLKLCLRCLSLTNNQDQQTRSKTLWTQRQRERERKKQQAASAQPQARTRPKFPKQACNLQMSEQANKPSRLPRTNRPATTSCGQQ